jgi:hypothetical protein
VDRAGAPHQDAPGGVLRTQLVAPPPRRHALTRRHLVGRLRAVSASGRLALVTAVRAGARPRWPRRGSGPSRTTLVTLRDRLADRGNRRQDGAVR